MNDRKRALVAAMVWTWALLLTSPSSAQASAPLPLRFETNVGQFAAPVRYLARGRRFALFLTASGATLTLQRSDAAAAGPALVRMRLEGAAQVEPRGVSPFAGRSNYFGGEDSASFRVGVQNYARVRYESVLPGVDVEYYGTEGSELEYDFVLSPGATPSVLSIAFEGVSQIALRADGSARLQLFDGSELTEHAPVAYQLRAGKRVRVPVRYVLRDDKLAFEVSDYDAHLPLVIDPVLSYASYFGGSSYDEALGIAADAAGNTYLVGYTASTLFPTYSPEQPSHGGGAYDAFVVKLDPSGTNLVYSTYLGGSGADMAYAVAADALGNAYVTGLTTSPNFPLVAALQTRLGGGQDAFVTKITPSGSALAYSTYLGGSLDDYAKGIAVSATGAAYLVGTTFSDNFPIALALKAHRGGSQDAFVSQLSPAGTALVYSTFVGGAGTEYGNAIALDTAGSAYLVGSTTSADFPTLNARQPAHAGGGTDAFLSKLNAAGSAFVYSTYLGGSASDEALGVSAALSTPVVVGSTLSSNFPLASATQPVPGGSNRTDAFITRFDPSGTTFVYSTYLGGSGNDSATAVASDDSGNAYVVGQTDSPDLPLESPLDGQASYRGASDAFIAAIIPSGARFAYTSYLGGAAEDRGTAIALSPGRTHVLGNTRSTDLPKVDSIIGALVGVQDAFVVKLPSIAAVAAPALSGPWLVLLLLVLFSVGLLFLNAQRSARCRSAR